MNAVEIADAVSELIEEEFDGSEFPFAFLEAYGNKPTTIKRLRTGNTNKSDIDGGVLQTNNIHMLVCMEGKVTESLDQLRASPRTQKNKAKFILATDGREIEAEDLTSGDTLACDYDDFPSHFLFFAALAGISFTKSIKNPELDIRATSRLNKLYVELLKHNPDWATADRRHDMNQFMARLIFCFFAEDTDIFHGDDLFTSTIEQMSDNQSTNTHEVISELFRAMDIETKHNGVPDNRYREEAKISRWANGFPYVNGGLFAGTREVPKFSRIARTYLIHAGKLDWQKINPDIFGSMIQAVTDEEERGSLGMHYTSVENILKLLNPLFLDDLRAKLEEAGDNERKLLNLRKRMSKIRVFDPACGSGNFLVIAYKQMRDIEFEINKRRSETDQKSAIPIRNFCGIEIRDFPAEIARLALIIAEFQCDVVYRGQKDALAEFLPLNEMNWIVKDNALRLDWLSVCPPTETTVKHRGGDLFSAPIDQVEIDFENEGGEIYICSNPPYLGSTWQSKEQKADLEAIFKTRTKSWKSLDYVAGWFMKAAEYGTHTNAASALVSTNSICQGQQVAILWPLIFNTKHEICFAHDSFKWANLANHNAGVTVVIIGLSKQNNKSRKLYSLDSEKHDVIQDVKNINPYLVPSSNTIVTKCSRPNSERATMIFGNKPVDGGQLLLDESELASLGLSDFQKKRFVRKIYGSSEFIRGTQRYCLWINDEQLEEVLCIHPINERIQKIRKMRLSSRDKGANLMAQRPHQMREMNIGYKQTIIIPSVSSEKRQYLPVGVIDNNSTVTNLAFAMFDAPLWNMALIASRMHLIWIATVCGKLKTDFRYSNTLGWNTFPIPKLTEKNKADLTKCAEDILLAREAHFPATIADLYNPEKMPENLRYAHDRNDEVLERIYIGRRFKNDTERLEKLFELYTKMIGDNKREHR